MNLYVMQVSTITGFVNIISAPGIAMQIITTSGPDDSMIEVAIASLNAVLEEEPEENANS